MWYCLFNDQGIYIDLYRDSYYNSIISLEKDLFDEPYESKDLLLPESVKEHIVILHLFNSFSSIGYANIILTKPSANLDRIGINKVFQRSGYGRLLLNFLIAYLYHEYKICSIQLEVNSANKNAFKFYKNSGFHINGRRKDYYGKGEDGVLMEYNTYEHLECLDVIYKKWEKGDAMNTNYEDTRVYLIGNCKEFKKHYEDHKAIHEKIDEIQKKLIVSDSEKMIIKSLKKQKLFLKDKMEEMIYEYIKSKKDESIT